MIFDKLKNVNLYKGLSANLDKALDIVAAENFADKENGRYEIEGDDIFYMVQEYQTRPIAQGRLEAHRKYIDIQIIVEGSEIIGIENLNSHAEETAYDDKSDIIFYEKTDVMTKLNISIGRFAVLFPDDLHMPCVTESLPAPVKKVVFKVKV